MTQRADRAVVEHGLGVLPARDLVKIEVDHGGKAAELRLAQHGARVIERAGHGLLREHRLAEFERPERDPRLQGRHGGNGNGLNRGVLDQRAPVPVRVRHIGGAGKLGRARGVAAGERRHFAAPVGAKCRQLHGASIIAADNAYADHRTKPGK